MNRRPFWFFGLAVAVLSLAAGSFTESALACNVPPAPMNPPPPVRIRFKTPTTVQLRIGGYATFGVGPGQFCACGLRTAGLGTITGVSRARIFSAGTNTPVPGFSFAPNDATTASFNGLLPGNWQGFFTPINTPVAPGIATDIVFDVIVVAGATFDNVAADLAAGTIGTAEAFADGTVMNDIDLNFVTAGDITELLLPWIANFGSSNSTSYWEDATNGPLLQSPNSPFPLQGGPDGMAFAPGATDDAPMDWMIWALSPSSMLEVTSMDRDTGVLTQVGSLVPSGGNNCEDIVTYLVLPGAGANAFIAAALATSNNLATFRLNRLNGALTLMQTVPTGPGPQNITVYDVAGQRMIATANCGGPDCNGPGSVSVFPVNPNTGQLLVGFPLVLTGGIGTVWVTTNRAGTLGVAANARSNDISTFTIDQVTGAWALQGTFPAGGLGTSSVAVDPSDQFVIATHLNSSALTVFAINFDNTLTQTSTVPTGATSFSIKFRVEPFGLAINPAFFYVPHAGSGNVSGFAFDSLTGNATPLPGSPYPAGAGPIKIKIVDALNPID